MKRLAAVFFLYAQHALEYKSRSLVWFLVILIDVSVYLLYWRGVFSTSTSTIPWTLRNAISYYLLLLIAGSFLQVHIEEEVAFEDIQLGRLSQYLLRPFSYIWFKFFQELPWRLIQGGFGLLTLLAIITVFHGFEITLTVATIPLVFMIILLGYAISFVYKMIIGIIAFWTTDYTGIQNVQSIIFLLFSGVLVPLHLLPDTLRSFALVQPLAYILYYPILAVQGVLPVGQLWGVMITQVFWLGALYFAYRVLWSRGIRQFTSIGQ